MDARAHTEHVDVDAAIAALVDAASSAVDRRATGSVYTSTDVCERLAGWTIVPWLLDAVADRHPEVPTRIARRLSTLDAAARGVLPATIATAGLLPGESPRDRDIRRAHGLQVRERIAMAEPMTGDLAMTLQLQPMPLVELAWNDVLDPAERATLLAALQAVRVLDPTCGAGEFLGAAVRCIAELRRLVGSAGGVDGAVALAGAVAGVDLSCAAVDACRRRLLLEVVRASGCAAGDAEVAREVLATQVVHGDAMQAGTLPAADVVLGNPPWVRMSRDGLAALGLQTARAANAYAAVLERSLASLTDGPSRARLGLVLPVSVASADEAAPVRQLLDDRLDAAWLATFDCVPQSLFPGTVQRVAILCGALARACATSHGSGRPPARWHVTRYHAWRAPERAHLLDGLRYVAAAPHRIGDRPGSIAKVGSALEVDLLDRLFRQPPLRDLVASSPQPDNRVWYKRRWSYFLFFSDRVPDIFDSAGERRMPSELKALDIDPSLDARVVLAVLASSLFHWFFTAYSDNRNVNRREIGALPFGRPCDDVAAELVDLADALVASMHEHSELRDCTYASGHTITNRYFAQGPTKPVVDAIDEVLARHHGLSQAQLEHLWWHDAARRGGRAPLDQLPGKSPVVPR